MILDELPEYPLIETWVWSTDIIVANNGSEQRISIRDYPRRSFSQKNSFDNVGALQSAMGLMFTQSKNAFTLPLYQYQTNLTASAAIAATSVSLTEALTELRVGGKMLVKEGAASQLLTISALTSTTVSFSTTPLTIALTTKAVATPAVQVVSAGAASVVRASLDTFGSLSLATQETSPQIPFLRASNAVTIETYDGLPVIDKGDLGNSFEQSIDNGLQLIEYESGNIQVRSNWLHSQIQTPLTYLCQRFFKPADWDWWKKFANYCKGSQKPFWIASQRPDLPVVGGYIANASTSFLTPGTVFRDYYANVAALKSFVIRTKGGIHCATATATAVEVSGGVTCTRIYFTPTFALHNVDWGVDVRVSFMQKVRITNDTFELEHHPLHTLINFSVRTVDA